MTSLTFSAPSYALLQATTQCWKRAKATPVTTVWVPSFVDNEDVEEPDDEPVIGGTAILGYIKAHPWVQGGLQSFISHVSTPVLRFPECPKA
ncbi:hypothetical protein CPBF367_34780 [Xanthomonas arboricola pv. juglandis]|uniref:hypothetical protein n=1 Tax=Xanthomonas euroxanthea TaxID=2259622 RepID=UPI000E90CEA1|nr:hypothetical protein [Xanthomonas euroxanthea]SYZ56808.1 hypothetical protein CPBF367_34780 [Xanthomonas arboricola pv. juglandis]